MDEETRTASDPKLSGLEVSLHEACIVQIYGGDIVYVPPTILAKAGYAVNAVLFPFQGILGIGTRAVGVAVP